MRPWLPLISVAAAATIVWLGVETRRLAELAGGFEREAQLAQAQLARAHLTAVPAPATPAAAMAAAPAPAPVASTDQDPVAYAQMALELATTRSQLAAVTKLLEQRNAEAERRAAAVDRDNAANLQPVPEGVRRCLQSLQDCLREEGFTAYRFLGAARLDGEGLHEVELLDTAGAEFGATFLSAARMTASLDRASGRLELRFFDGHRTVAGVREAIGADGFPLVFAEVDGRAIEARLPYLVRAEGQYPEPVADDRRRPTDLDPISRRQWFDRFDRLLATAGTNPRWRLSRFRGLDRGDFLDVELVGADARNRVVAGAHCARMAVEVDARGVVSLWLRSGVLQNEGVESSINAEGYRMLLPNLTPKQATDAMLGMVVHK
ncbi:MAG: hypothetical protein MUC36_15705 [Planctomycetes bacterium]|jgi:hypothetical protein|nr:hypothetical protein [Planctomycetota bacterium]